MSKSDRLRQAIEDEQNQRGLLRAKLGRLRAQYAAETRDEEKFRLEHLIAQTQAELAPVEARLDELEKQLAAESGGQAIHIGQVHGNAHIQQAGRDIVGGDKIVQTVQGNGNIFSGSGTVIVQGGNAIKNDGPKKTILFLAANPLDTDRLRLDQEIRDIQEGLRRAQGRDQFHFVQRLAATPQDLGRALLDEAPAIVHFAGHGSADGLLLQGCDGYAKIVAPAALADTFALFAGQIECVVLNACYSAAQAEALAGQVPYVAGMSSKIDDHSARAFAVAFYDALAAGKDYPFAFKFARNAISLQGLPDAAVPHWLEKT